MSHRKAIQKELVKKGFHLARSKNHFVYKREADGKTIIVPNHNKMNHNTFKSLLKEIKIS